MVEAPRGGSSGEVEVRRSHRRRSTVSAYRQDGRTVVLIPAGFTSAQEQRWVDTMLGRLAAGERRRRPGDEALTARAAELSARYLGGAARPTSVRWVSNQRSRWGSCTPADGTVRVSDRLEGVPGYVLDYVLLHELAHLVNPTHDGAFWALLAPLPRVERARGYLEGLAAAGRTEPRDARPDAAEEPVSVDAASHDAVSGDMVSRERVRPATEPGPLL